MFLPMLWPIVLIGTLAAVVVLIMRSGKTFFAGHHQRILVSWLWARRGRPYRSREFAGGDRQRKETPSWRPDVRRQTPFEILSERFARGEIDRREYEERKGLLSQP
jgi:uncharacterized membrane protein